MWFYETIVLYSWECGFLIDITLLCSTHSNFDEVDFVSTASAVNTPSSSSVDNTVPESVNMQEIPSEKDSNSIKNVSYSLFSSSKAQT